jgi:hypothetical protein
MLLYHIGGRNAMTMDSWVYVLEEEDENIVGVFTDALTLVRDLGIAWGYGGKADKVEDEILGDLEMDEISVVTVTGGRGKKRWTRQYVITVFGLDVYS